jgi:membrane associated rhomboid family serine protease
VPLVYLVAAIGGSMASTLISPTTSVGASGGVLGLAGYLLVSLRGQPGTARWIRKRMFALLGTTAAMGIMLFFVIDNGGHLGGALTGAAVGLLGAPRADAMRPEGEQAWGALAWISATVLLAGAAFTILRLLHVAV